MGKPHYDQDLWMKLPTTNLGESLILNSEFTSWGLHLKKNLAGLCYFEKNAPYKKSEDLELLAFCEDHAEQHSKQLSAPNIILFTHPLYLQMNHMDSIVTKQKKMDVVEYSDSFFKLVYANLPRDKVQVLLLDTIYNYAAATSLLLENGSIDRVFFTRPTSGFLNKKLQLDELKGKRLFWGGLYHKHCLNRSLLEADTQLGSLRYYQLIKDLILNSPMVRGSTLKPQNIYGILKNFPDSNIISLQEVFRKFDIDH